jgi:dienelactone hydrolase
VCALAYKGIQIGQSNLSAHAHISAAAAAANDVRLPSTTFQAVQETVRSPSSALTSTRAEKMALQNFSESSHQFNNANLQSSTVSHSSVSRNTQAAPQLNSRFSSGNLLPDVNIPTTMTPGTLHSL